jgi:hypothetical protein
MFTQRPGFYMLVRAVDRIPKGKEERKERKKRMKVVR